LCLVAIFFLILRIARKDLDSHLDFAISSRFTGHQVMVDGEQRKKKHKQQATSEHPLNHFIIQVSAAGCNTSTLYREHRDYSKQWDLQDLRT
jgi:hypothetical protein